MDRRNNIWTSFLDPVHTTYGREQYGTGSDTRNQNTVLTWDNVLTYGLTFKEKNKLDLMAVLLGPTLTTATTGLTAATTATTSCRLSTLPIRLVSAVRFRYL